MNPMYSPVAAVKHSNMEALKATPREFVQDSLEKHVPLQGTAMVPPGERYFGGRIMRYEEGADVMREADAPGGAYGRWEGQVRNLTPLLSFTTAPFSLTEGAADISP
jgi:hypothetical protein